jgi:hypothetical protein
VRKITVGIVAVFTGLWALYLLVPLDKKTAVPKKTSAYPVSPSHTQLADLEIALKNAKLRNEQLKSELRAQPTAPAIPAGAVPFNPADMGALAVEGMKTALERDNRLLLSELNLNQQTKEDVLSMLASYRLRKITSDELYEQLALSIGSEKTELVKSSVTDPITWTKVQTLDDSFRYANSALDKEQRSSLSQLVAAETRTFPYPRDKETLSEILALKHSNNQRIIEEASSFLSARQIRILITQLNDDFALQKVSVLKMKKDSDAEQSRTTGSQPYNSR